MEEEGKDVDKDGFISKLREGGEAGDQISFGKKNFVYIDSGKS